MATKKKRNTNDVTPGTQSTSKANAVDSLVETYKQLRAQNGGKYVGNAELNKAWVQNNVGNQDLVNYQSQAKARKVERQQASDLLTGINGSSKRNYVDQLAVDYSNALTGRYEKAAKRVASATSSEAGASAVGSLGAAVTSNLKKTGTKSSGVSMANRGSILKAAAGEGVKSKQQQYAVTAENVKATTGRDKMYADNAKWAARAMKSAENDSKAAADSNDIAKYRDAVQRYESASNAYISSYSKARKADESIQAQREYVKEHAGTEQGKKLQAEYDRLKEEASMAKDTSMIYSSEDKARFDKASENADARLKELKNLIDINSYYSSFAGKTEGMTSKELSAYYDSYADAKDEYDNATREASAARKQADKYLNQNNTAMYTVYAARAEQSQVQADKAKAKMDDITGGDDSVAYAIETASAARNLEETAKSDKDFSAYVKLGEKAVGGHRQKGSWVPQLRGAFENVLSAIGYTDDAKQLINQMSETQKQVFQYYIGRGDKESAQAYFSALESSLEEKRTANEQADTAKFAEKHPVASVAANAIASTMTPVLGVASVAENAAQSARNAYTGTYSPPLTNTTLNLGTVANQGTQVGVSKSLQNKFNLSDNSANFWAGTIISMANNAAQFGLAGGGAALNLAGVRRAVANVSGSEAAKVAAQAAVDKAAQSINEVVPLVLMSTQAGTDTIREQLDQGASPFKALLYGGLCGAVEAWTEKIGVDSWVELATDGIKSGLLKSAWKASGKIDRTKLQNIVKSAIGLGNQALSEGGEEIISNVVDCILDVAINGDDSEFMQYRDQLMVNGESEAEATRKATIQFYGKNSLESFAGGAVSGLVFGAFNIPAQLQSDNHIGQAIIDNGTDLDLVDAGLEYSENTEVYKIANKIREKLDSDRGYQPTAKEIAKLSIAMAQQSQVSAESKANAADNAMSDGTDNSLSTFATQLQGTGKLSGREAQRANDALRKAMSGDVLTAKEIRSLKTDIPAVRTIIGQKLGTTLLTGDPVEVRSAIQSYIQNQRTQSAAQAKAQGDAKDIIRDAAPYARKAANAQTQDDVAAVRAAAEDEAQLSIDQANADNEATVQRAAAEQAANTVARIGQEADVQPKKKGNSAISNESAKAGAPKERSGQINFKTFSDSFSEYAPKAGNRAAVEAYRDYQERKTIRLDGKDYTRETLKESMESRGVKFSNEDAERVFANISIQEHSDGNEKHFSLNDVVEDVKNKNASTGVDDKQKPEPNDSDSAGRVGERANTTAASRAEMGQMSPPSNTESAVSNRNNQPGPTGKYDEAHPNRIATWMSKDASTALKAMGLKDTEISIDYTMDKHSNGYYEVKDGKRRIVLNGQLGGTTRNGQVYSAQQNIRFVISHEIGHLVQGVGYTGETNSITNEIIGLYQELNNQTEAETKKRVSEIMAKYVSEAERDGSSLGLSKTDITTEYATGEYAADCLGEMLGNYNTIRKMAKAQNQSVARQIIQRVLDKLIAFRKAIPSKGKAPTSVDTAIAGIYDEAAQNLESMLKKAVDTAKWASATSAPTDGSTKSTVRAELGRTIDKYITPDAIKNQIEKVVEMKPVAELSGKEFQKDPNKSLDKMMHEFFAGLGNAVDTKTLGRVILDDTGIGSDIGHGVFSRKSAAIAAIPDVLAQGEIIDYQKNWKNRPYETVCIAAPVTLRGSLYYEGVIVRRLNYGDSFYTHDVLLAEAAGKAKDGALPQKTGSSENQMIARSKTPSIASLLLKVSEVKSQNSSAGGNTDSSDARFSLSDEELDDFMDTFGEDSPTSLFDGMDEFRKGTESMSKSRSTQLAAQIKKDYGTSMNTELLATRLRQMAGSQAATDYVRASVAYETETADSSTSFAAQREAEAELVALAREVAGNIVDAGWRTERGDTTVYDYLRDKLRSEKIYIPDNLKKDIATALQADSWNEARRKYFDILSNTVNDASKGVDIATFYENISSEFPGAVETGLLARSDMIEAIVDAYQRSRNSRSVEHNPLEGRRDQIADRIYMDLKSQMDTQAEKLYREYAATQEAKANRLERQAAYQARNGDQKTADELRSRADDERLVAQTDEETILDAVYQAGFGGEKAEQRLQDTVLDPDKFKDAPELQRIAERVMRENRKKSQLKKISQVRANTFENSDFFTQAELALDGMRKEDYTYRVRTEGETFGEAASRLYSRTKADMTANNSGKGAVPDTLLDRSEVDHQKEDLSKAAKRLDDNFLNWYDTLKSKQHWTAVDLDTAMMILNQIRINDRETGDYRDTANWAKLIQERGTEGGQFIQAFAKWGQTPEGMLAKASQELDDKHLGQKTNSKAIQKLDEGNQLLNDQIVKQRNSNDEMRQELDALTKERDDLRAELKKVTSDKDTMTNETINVFDQIERYNDRLVELAYKMMELEKTKSSLEEEQKRWEEQVREAASKRSNLEEENRQIVLERDRLKSQKDILDDTSTRLQDQISVGRKEIDALKAILDGLREKTGFETRSLEEVINEMQDIVAGLKTNGEDIVKKNSVLKKLLQTLTRDYSPDQLRQLVRKTTDPKLNSRFGELMDNLLDNVTSEKKAQIMNDMTRIADMLSTAESWQIAVNSGDKVAESKMRNQLIECIIQAAKTRGMIPNRKSGVEKRLRDGFANEDTKYLNSFARKSLANIAADFERTSFGNKLSTTQYVAQLLNPRTAMRNVASNAMFQGVDTLARNLATPIDWLLGQITGHRTVSHSFHRNNDTTFTQGATSRAARAYREVRLDVDTETGSAKSKYGEGARRTYKMAQRGIVSGVMSRLEMVNGFSLNVSDEFFKGAIFQGTINSSAKLVEAGLMTQDEAIEFATQDMLYRTFQDDTYVGRLLNVIHDGLNMIGTGTESGKTLNGKVIKDFGLGDLVIKYRGVPGALVTRAIEYSPVGALKAFYNIGVLAQTKGRNTQAQRNAVLGLSRAFTGSGLVALIAYLASKGILRREDDEDDKNVAALDKAEGLGGTQINLSALARGMTGGNIEWKEGDALWDIGFADPLSSAMTMGTMVSKNMKDNNIAWYNPSAWVPANASMVGAAFSDLSMMDTVNDIIYASVYHDDASDLSIGADVGITFATSALSGFWPSAIRQVAQATDNNYRDSYGGGNLENTLSSTVGPDTAAALQTAANQLMVNVPGLRQMVPKKLDPLGNEKVYSPTNSAATRFLNAFINPGKGTTYTRNSMSEEMGRVRRLTGDSSFYPSRSGPNSVTYGDERIKLTDVQKRKYLQDTGSLYQELATETMGTDAYKDGTNERKAQLLKDVKSYVEFKAKQNLYEALHLKDKGYTQWNGSGTWDKTEEGMESGVSFGTMRQILNDTSESKMPPEYDADGETISGSREAKLFEYLDGYNYSDDDKLKLYSIIRGADSERSTEKIRTIMDAGLSFREAGEVKKVYNEINDGNANTTSMNNRDFFNKWLVESGYSDSQIDTINDTLKFYSMVPQQESSVLKRLTASGMDYDDAYRVANNVAALDPEDGEDEVSTAQKYDVVLNDSSMTTAQKQEAIAAIYGDKSLVGDLDESTAETMIDLYRRTGKTDAITANSSDRYSIDGESYDYTDDQKSAYDDAYIQMLNNIGGSSISSTKTMDAIKDIASNAGKYAAFQQAGMSPDIDSSDFSSYRKATQAMDAGLGLAQYCEIKATCNGFEADKNASGKSISGSKKKKVVAYLKSQGLTSAQYNFFYHTVMGYK